MAGLPCRIVGPGDRGGVRTLILPPSKDGESVRRLSSRLQDFVAGGGRILALGERITPITSESEGQPEVSLVWARERPGPTYLERHPALRGIVGRVAMALYRAYFDRRTFRRLLDGMHITHRMLQGGSEYNPLFRLPPPEERAALLEALGDPAVPRVRAGKPVLIEWWRQGETDQLHLVNYADEPQDVIVAFPRRVRARVLSPDVGETPVLEGSSLRLSLDVYTILVCES